VEKGPTAVSIGRGTEPLYSSLSKRYGAFLSEYTIYSGDGRKGAGLGKGGVGRGAGEGGCFSAPLQAK